MNPVLIRQDDSIYPSNLKKSLADSPKTISAIGNLDILQNNTLAILSSVKCPGSLILKTYDLMRKIRETGTTVVSGFHSPMEAECLNILLSGKQPIILCLARSLDGIRIKPEYKKPLEEGRLLILSPFNRKHNRISSERANIRNHFVAAIADEIFVPYAEPRSRTEALCRDWIKKGKSIKTFDSDCNKNLFKLGAKFNF